MDFPAGPEDDRKTAMEKAPKIENREKKHISKIHFLIHPGFVNEAGRQSSPKKDDIEAGLALLNRYVERAKTLPEDEIMVAFPYFESQLKDHIQEQHPYDVTLRELRNILGKRLIVLTNDVHVTPESASDAIEKIGKICESRNYFFDKNVLTDAYGEMLAACVYTGSEKLKHRRTVQTQNHSPIRSERRLDISIQLAARKKRLQNDIDNLEIE